MHHFDIRDSQGRETNETQTQNTIKILTDDGIPFIQNKSRSFHPPYGHQEIVERIDEARAVTFDSGSFKLCLANDTIFSFHGRIDSSTS